MKRPTPSRRARLAFAAAMIAVLVGALVPTVDAAAPASAAIDGQMVFPASGNIQSKVGDGCRNNYRAHEGIDITGPGGTPILAAYDGVIKSRTSNAGYGNYTDIEHPGGYVTRYAHMASAGTYAPGTRVVRGQQIGVIGKTGATSANHLHFEVRRNGSVYTAINNGFTCLSNVTRGAIIPMSFPGLAVANPKAVASADYDGDGRADLLAVAGDSDLQFLPGNGSGGFGSAQVVTSAWGAHRHLTHADFNNDGRGDMLIVRGDGVLEFYGGGATGGFGQRAEIAEGWSGMLHVTSGADYTGDGKQDLLAVGSDGVMTIYRGDGSGGLQPPHTTLGGGWQDFRFLVGGDFNGDGRGDILGLDAGGSFWFYPGTTNGFGSRSGVGSYLSDLTALTGGVDYNGDGIADLMGRNTAGELLLYAGIGNGAFRGAVRVGTGWAHAFQIE